MDRTAVARTVSRVFYPLVVPIPVIGAVLVWDGLGPGAAAGWTAALLAPLLLPSVGLMGWERRTGRRDGWTVPERSDRARYYTATTLALLAAVLLARPVAPQIVISLLAAMLAVVAAAGLVNTRTKLSVHAGAPAAAAAIATARSPPLAAALLLLAAVVGWARVVEDRHTPAQVAVGIAVFGGAAFLAFHAAHPVPI